MHPHDIVTLARQSLGLDADVHLAFDEDLGEVLVIAAGDLTTKTPIHLEGADDTIRVLVADAVAAHRRRP